VIGTVLVCGLAVLLLWQSVMVRIPPGHVGVLYSLLAGGTVTDAVYREGLAFKLPWNQMYIFETRIQALPFTLLAFSAEGMPITVEATTLYRVKGPTAPRLLTEVGMDYEERIVAPISRDAVRRVIGRYSSHDIYTLGADYLEAELLEYLRSTTEAQLLFYSQVPIRSVRLPDRLVGAIEDKLSQQQLAASYEFRLISAKQEAERQRIQAIGLRNFYSIVQAALTDKLLTWRGIEATVEVSKSPNTKIVIVGGNKDQMPLILGSDITRTSPTPEQPVPPISGNASPLPNWADLPPIFELPQPAKPQAVPPTAGGTPVPSLGPRVEGVEGKQPPAKGP
jgi:regulator of protease activity HflC (stomatin/prohibitin superfamily)